MSKVEKKIDKRKKATRKVGRSKENLLAALEKFKIKESEPVPVTEKEEVWCRTFIKTLNAAEASRAAGFTGKTVAKVGYDMKTRPQVLMRLAQLWEKKKEELKLDADDVLEELGRIAKADIRDIVEIDENGTNITLKKDFDGRAVKSISQTYDAMGLPRIKIEFWSKDKALENYGRYHKLFTDNVNNSVTGQVQVFKIGEQEIEF